MEIEDCYQCSHYQVCFLRKGIDDLLDDAHHKEIVGGKPIVKNSIPLPFFRLLADMCKIKSYKEE